MSGGKAHPSMLWAQLRQLLIRVLSYARPAVEARCEASSGEPELCTVYLYPPGGEFVSSAILAGNLEIGLNSADQWHWENPRDRKSSTQAAIWRESTVALPEERSFLL